MKPLPTDPFALQARVFNAFCADLFDMAAGRAASCERTNALREISKSRDGSGNATSGNPLPVKHGD